MSVMNLACYGHTWNHTRHEMFALNVYETLFGVYTSNIKESRIYVQMQVFHVHNEFGMLRTYMYTYMKSHQTWNWDFRVWFCKNRYEESTKFSKWSIPVKNGISVLKREIIGPIYIYTLYVVCVFNNTVFNLGFWDL